MPSVFTIEGTDIAAPKKSKRPRSSGGLASANAKIGDCKTVRNPRTGCSMQLCFVGKAHSRTGWKFKKGSSSCTRK